MEKTYLIIFDDDYMVSTSEITDNEIKGVKDGINEIVEIGTPLKKLNRHGDWVDIPIINDIVINDDTLKITINGKSGSGKTTLAHVIMNALSKYDTEITIHNEAEIRYDEIPKILNDAPNILKGKSIDIYDAQLQR
jgi:ABC-type transport system involved in cytochrome bd biosynthesis fused ATPase/permease subunit